MAVYTELTPTDLKEIADIFNLPEITSVQNFAGGQENSNYHLQAGGQDFVLTLCENKTAKEAQILIDTLRHLEIHDFNTTRIIPASDGVMQARLHGKPLLLKSYLSGQVIDPLPFETMFPLGRAIARLHQVPAPDFLPNQLAYGRETFGPMQQNFGGPHPFLDWLKRLEEYLKKHLSGDLPRALIHADIFADNVILTPGYGPVIMDFEEATNYYRVFDLGMAIVGTCYPEGRADLRAKSELLRGYRSVVMLTEAEETSLHAATIYAAAAMASWRFWQFNVVQPGAGKQAHYEALQKIAQGLLAEEQAG
ncbi:phosphotransferase [Neolewinella persica]|uniref:phosphotransferase n=1 Tax=Neolewinella persica TaxID=70998 RepID=UPI000366DF84|nr:phosphotransferase [Neolewinella persica]